MDLLLWRHAEAESRIPDAMRALTPRGREQAKGTAHWLAGHAPRGLRVLVSPSVRTRQTIEVWRRDYELCPGIALGAKGEDLLALASWPENRDPVLLVGHQPSLGEAAGLILGIELPGLVVKKGALWWFQSREREGKTQAVLRAVIPAGAW